MIGNYGMRMDINDLIKTDVQNYKNLLIKSGEIFMKDENNWEQIRKEADLIQNNILNKLNLDKNNIILFPHSNEFINIREA